MKDIQSSFSRHASQIAVAIRFLSLFSSCPWSARPLPSFHVYLPCFLDSSPLHACHSLTSVCRKISLPALFTLRSLATFAFTSTSWNWSRRSRRLSSHHESSAALKLFSSKLSSCDMRPCLGARDVHSKDADELSTRLHAQGRDIQPTAGERAGLVLKGDPTHGCRFWQMARAGGGSACGFVSLACCP
eukprot:753983-Hanusia_phi.AAC.2